MKTLAEWIAAQDTRDTAELLRRAHLTPITGYTPRQVVRERDRVQAIAERLAKAIAVEAGITRVNTLAEMDAKLKAMIAAAATAAKPLAVYRAAQFWIAYFRTQDIEAGGEDSVTETVQDPVYGKSPAEENGWGNVTGDTIERAMRGTARAQ